MIWRHRVWGQLSTGPLQRPRYRLRQVSGHYERSPTTPEPSHPG